MEISIGYQQFHEFSSNTSTSISISFSFDSSNFLFTDRNELAARFSCFFAGPSFVDLELKIDGENSDQVVQEAVYLYNNIKEYLRFLGSFSFSCC